MASRRLRIKPVANVPIRRGKNASESVKSAKASENGEKEDLIKQTQEDASDTRPVDGNSNDINCSPSEDSEQNNIPHSVASEQNNIPHSVADLCSQSVSPGFNDVAETLTAGPHDADETIKSRVSISGMEAETVGNEAASTKCETIISGISSLSDKKVPPGLVRKRMKPPVSIPAAARRPRVSSEILNGDKLASTSSVVNCIKNIQEECAQQHTVRNEDVSERTSPILPCYPKENNEVPFSSGKGIGVGVPGITQTIPTGTAIRPQYDRNTGVSTLDVNGEAPQSLPEPDLPSEGAGGGYSSVLLKPSSSQVNVVQRSRFIKPGPCILDPSMRKRKFAGSSVSGNESDDSRKIQSSDSLPYDSSGKVMPEQGRPKLACQTSNMTDQTESRKQGSEASASESEDEPRKCMSDASNVSPVIRKPIETSRGRFVRPTPRFMEASMRRNSIQISASETEEEFKKGTSMATSPHKKETDLTSEDLAVTLTDTGSIEEAEKKVIRTRRAASSCMQRMAKARLEFHNKFGNRTPDRSRLTMFDLIFYNPATNPMKCSGQESENSKLSQSQDTVGHAVGEQQEEEKVDEPTVETLNEQNDETAADEEDMAMPVPQVKVGPDGQIILDEKSLVIETTGTKKSREDLANSALIVDYGTGSTGYGTYSKKGKKFKEWSKQETLKFYRALNRVGTDFLLMQSIFPKRTRRDLKIKFKKEDRTNRFLVEKALRYPLDFDLTELEKDLEKEEEEERQAKLAKELNRKPPRQIKQNNIPSKKNMKARKGFVCRSMDPGDTGDLPEKKKQGDKRRDDEGNVSAEQPHKTGGGSCSSLSSSSDDENELEYYYKKDLKFRTENYPLNRSIKSDNSNEASDDTAELKYLSKSPKPTRSGRIPQQRKHSETEDYITLGKKRKRKSSNLVGSENISKPGTESKVLPLEDLTNVEPGSLVVIATQSPTNPAHHVYKVFMVAPKPVGLQSPAATVSPETVPLSPTSPFSVTSNIPNSQLHGESQSLVSGGNLCVSV
ncbi:hypothetical protein B7P43_G02346 [Cryptotermes secundus]|nr:uncharacterized protein LOC111872018 isoform X2 [Cryptotermes secundus]XP_023721255.1 uncharacterized protein LOC111872018 isoform X2 [Cryptotermes secundus]XP_023721256.1 uncharacterized protein LOC111872018 isoform X2 [Cryptotermes secundus]XP_023721257.1 uncharacterized protein LOC111872018 isoform X2 [Cryptotermes secundus]XP_023721258.1 uncharacterized protein LOC111872018 isoform X2 [Cryptotermes secundus]XP_023721259.1 uncharacterized protein LOC111872018 isoform X2 [Cryptotermes sec